LRRVKNPRFTPHSLFCAHVAARFLQRICLVSWQLVIESMMCLFGLFTFDRSIDLDAKTINEIRQLPWGRLVGDNFVILNDLGQIASGLLEISQAWRAFWMTQFIVLLLGPSTRQSLISACCASSSSPVLRAWLA
jgi:hypothetical protein